MLLPIWFFIGKCRSNTWFLVEHSFFRVKLKQIWGIIWINMSLFRYSSRMQELFSFEKRNAGVKSMKTKTAKDSWSFWGFFIREDILSGKKCILILLQIWACFEKCSYYFIFFSILCYFTCCYVTVVLIKDFPIIKLPKIVNWNKSKSIIFNVKS